MTDLLSRLSAATGPSRELDAEIALANGWHRIKTQWENPQGHFAQPPRYTESIDAAMTLVPDIPKAEGSLWLKIAQFAGAIGSNREAWTAEIWGIKSDREVKWYGIHCSPAIALVIACLKARMEKDNAVSLRD